MISQLRLPSLFFLMVLLSGAGTAAENDAEFNVFNEPGLGYVISYPGDWEATLDGSTLEMHGPREHPSFMISLEIQNMLTTLSGGGFSEISEVVDYLRQKFREQHPGVTFGETDSIQFEDQGYVLDGKKFKGEYFNDTHGMSFRYSWVVLPRPDGQLFHVFIYSGPVQVEGIDVYETVKPETIKIMQTLTLRDAEGNPLPQAAGGEAPASQPSPGTGEGSAPGWYYSEKYQFSIQVPGGWVVTEEEDSEEGFLLVRLDNQQSGGVLIWAGNFELDLFNDQLAQLWEKQKEMENTWYMAKRLPGEKSFPLQSGRNASMLVHAFSGSQDGVKALTLMGYATRGAAGFVLTGMAQQDNEQIRTRVEEIMRTFRFGSPP